MKSSGPDLLKLLNSRLYSESLEVEQIPLHLQLIDLDIVTHEVETLLADLAQRHQVNAHYRVANNLDSLYLDRRKFKHILLNLVCNAIQYNNPHGTVEVNLFPTIDRQWLTGEVTDDGNGIPTNIRPALFFPRSSTGLCVTNYLIELHGGSMNIESAVNKGTQVVFRIPINLTP